MDLNINNINMESLLRPPADITLPSLPNLENVVLPIQSTTPNKIIEDENNNDSTLKKRKNASLVWERFERPDVKHRLGGNYPATCKLCNTTLQIFGYSTSRLLNHVCKNQNGGEPIAAIKPRSPAPQTPKRIKPNNVVVPKTAPKKVKTDLPEVAVFLDRLVQFFVSSDLSIELLNSVEFRLLFPPEFEPLFPSQFELLQSIALFKAAHPKN